MIKNKILITGGYGFLGSYLVKKLYNNGYNVIILEKEGADDWRLEDMHNKIDVYYYDRNNLDSIFDENKIEVIINTAVNYGRDRPNSEIITDNIIMPLRLLEYGIDTDLRLFINTDSYFTKSKEYFNYLKEYTRSKKHLKEWLKDMDELTIINLVLEHIYGPYDSPKKFVTFIINSLKEEIPSIELTEGSQKRDFIYVEDVANLYLKIITQSEEFTKGYHEFEVGTGQSISIKEFVLKVKNILNNDITELKFGKKEMRENELMESHADINMIPEFIEWHPLYSLEEGITNIINKVIKH